MRITPIVSLILVFNLAARADEAVPQPQAAPPSQVVGTWKPLNPYQWTPEEYEKACSPLFTEPVAIVRQKLLAYETVFGKPAIRWDESDYLQLIGLAAACNGIKKDGFVIDANNWRATIEGVRNVVLPVAILATEVDKYAAKLPLEEINLPACRRFLDFTFEYYDMTDKSMEMFGRSFMQMSDSDLDSAVKYTNQCQLFLPDVAKASKGWREIETRNKLDRIMDKILTIKQRRADWHTWTHRDSDLVMKDPDGAIVPPTMTSALTREMILRYNRAASLQRRFTPETISVLIKLADDAELKNKNAYDMLYIAEVRKRVQEEIFRR